MAPLTEHERKTLVRLLNKLGGLAPSSHMEARSPAAAASA
jgi:hypothetical protein